jgi:hypothetical protein
MTDRELLELAAKAAGIEIKYNYLGTQDARCAWYPLDDDGDALRLAVKLRLTIYHTSVGVSASEPEGRSMLELNGTDPDAATRRAIVRAAAEIGRQMP